MPSDSSYPKRNDVSLPCVVRRRIAFVAALAIVAAMRPATAATWEQHPMSSVEASEAPTSSETANVDPVDDVWAEVRAGDAAADGAEHGKAIEHYERALALLGNAPEWGAQANQIRRLLARSYLEWYRVVGDPVDLRKAQSLLRAYIAALPAELHEERAHAQKEIDEIDEELAARRAESPQSVRVVEAKPTQKPVERVEIQPTDELERWRLEAKRRWNLQRIAMGCSGFAVVALGVGGFSLWQYAERYDEALTKLSTGASSAELEKYYDRRDRWHTTTVATAVIGGAAVVAAATLFTRAAFLERASLAIETPVQSPTASRWGLRVGLRF